MGFSVCLVAHCSAFQCSFLFLYPVRLHISIKFTTFSNWLACRDEGFLLPDRLPLKGMFKINTTPNENGFTQRR